MCPSSRMAIKCGRQTGSGQSSQGQAVPRRTGIRRPRPQPLPVSWGTQTSFFAGPHDAAHEPATDCADPAYARHCALLLFCAPSTESPVHVCITARRCKSLRPDTLHPFYVYSVLFYEAIPNRISGCKAGSTANLGHVGHFACFNVLVRYRSCSRPCREAILTLCLY